MSNRISLQLKGLLYAIVTALLWGVLAIALKVSLKDVSPLNIAWFRFALAFFGLAFYYFWKKPEYLRILRRPPLLLILASLCLGINYLGFITGIHLTSPGVAQLFIQTGPVLLAAAGFIFFKEKIIWRQIIGFMLVIGGLLLFSREQGCFMISDLKTYHTGIGWVLLAAVAWAFYSILVKLLVQRHPPMQLNLVIFGLPALFFLPFVKFTGFANLSFIDWIILIFLGLNTLFAYGTLALAIRYIEASKVSIIIILNPVLTFALMGLITLTNASWIAHEHYTIPGMTGAVVMLSGAVLSILKPPRYKV
ncbi:MAG: DMT family transporter [Bacteroidales bacterium]|nr:DMT family transporter [Bacteroidales bacterium]MBN2763047.1 DMT family transporter [Bacteroidales bacterium]